VGDISSRIPLVKRSSGSLQIPIKNGGLHQSNSTGGLKDSQPNSRVSHPTVDLTNYESAPKHQNDVDNLKSLVKKSTDFSEYTPPNNFIQNHEKFLF
jgi:hypothetical protein